LSWTASNIFVRDLRFMLPWKHTMDDVAIFEKPLILVLL
jgi:hypothetical protein